LFRIPAKAADLSHFTPESNEIVFVGSATQVDPYKIALANLAPHVERWRIADQTRVESTTLPTLVCGTEELSPDGRVFVCLDLNSTLRFIEVSSGVTILQRKEFTWLLANHDRSGAPTSFYGQLGSASVDFSPDDRFVVVRPRTAGGSPLAWNMRQRTIVRLTGQLKHHTTTFIAPGRVVLWVGPASKSDLKQGVAHGRVLEFPSGKVLSEPKLPEGSYLFPAADPDFVIVRPFGRGTAYKRVGGEFFVGHAPMNRAAAVELSTGLVIIGNTPQLDVFKPFYVAKPNPSEVGLYEIGKGLRASVSLLP
jgi:hypothetical protein